VGAKQVARKTYQTERSMCDNGQTNLTKSVVRHRDSGEAAAEKATQLR
jgi:hypothetical protein